MSLVAGKEFLHNEFDAGPEDVIEVTLDHPANVQVLDPENYEKYRNRLPFRYHGGYVTASPYEWRPPRRDRWHVVIDLGGGPGSVQAWLRVTSGSHDNS